jgi:hypothetical protein
MATVSDPRNPIKSRKATRPATGTARWLVRPSAEGAGGVLAINGSSYEVLPFFDDDGARLGWRLLKVGTLCMYDLPADLSGCDCPDRTFNPERPGGGCKHMLALRAALRAAGLL